jgi:hypothetical protein
VLDDTMGEVLSVLCLAIATGVAGRIDWGIHHRLTVSLRRLCAGQRRCKLTVLLGCCRLFAPLKGALGSMAAIALTT